MQKVVSVSSIVPKLPRPSCSLKTKQRQVLHSSRALFQDSLFDPTSSEEIEELQEDDFISNFDELLNQSTLVFEVGQKVKGMVFDVDESGVYVDFGGKEMGFCSVSELGLKKVANPLDLIKPGSKREFIVGAVGVKSRRLGAELTLLSRVNLVKEVAYKRLRQMSEFQVKMQVTVLRKNAGGYIVEDEIGLHGFLPGRQALVNPASSSIEEDDLLGQKITVKILDVFEETGKYVVTQRGIVDPGVDESKFAVGSVLEGVVEGVMPYGVFVNTGGISGLLHASQISGVQVQDVNSVFSVNDKVKVMVLGYDRGRGRLALSTKRLEPKPGDMLKNPAVVFERAEEMAEQFRKEVEIAASRAQTARDSPIVSDVSVSKEKLAAKERA